MKGKLSGRSNAYATTAPGGASGMRAEKIKGWLAVARIAEKGETADMGKADQ